MKTSIKQSKHRDPHPCDNIVRQTINKLSFQTTMNNIFRNMSNFVFETLTKYNVNNYIYTYTCTKMIFYNGKTIRSPDREFHRVGIVHFTVVCLVTRPSSGSEAGVAVVMIQTHLLFTCKSCCSCAN